MVYSDMVVQQQPTARSISVREASRLLGVKPRSVLRLIADGELPARKDLGRYRILSADVEIRRGVGSIGGRRYAPPQAWGLIVLASGGSAPWLDRPARWRIEQQLARRPFLDLRHALAGRALPRRFAAHPDSIARLRAEPGLMRSGVDAAEVAGGGVIGSNDRFEAYVRPEQVAELARRHHLHEDLEGSVVLRALPAGALPQPWPSVAPRMAIALDLLEDHEPRVRQVGRALLSRLGAERGLPPGASSDAPTRTLRIVPASDVERRLWLTLREVCELFADLPWVLVGGLMVRVLELKHGHETAIATVDVDAVIDVRAMPRGSHEAARRLMASGFEPQWIEGETVYRFARREEIVDVLVPDGLGPRADIVTVPPASTFRTVGGSRALSGRRTATLSIGPDTFEVPLPDLAGALVIKARAATSAIASKPKHVRDLARLLVLVERPYVMREALTDRERSHLRRHRALTDPGHDAWSLVADARRGAQALAVLID
jgi:excisionase family DNA binding protein